MSRRPSWRRALGAAAVLALAALASALLPAAPAQAQTTVWSATLKVDISSDDYGCGSHAGTYLNTCALSQQLTPQTFTHNGTQYTVESLYYEKSGTWNTNSRFYFELSGVTGANAKTALAGLTLNAGSSSYSIDGATAGTARLYWTTIPSPDWGLTQKVSVSLTAPATTTKPSKPSGLMATAGDQQVALSWANPSDSTITKYQYQQKAGNAAWGSWADISGSGATTTSYTVTGLTNGTGYRFRIRAVNAAGNSPQSNATPAVTPKASTSTVSPPANAVWSATLTVDVTSDNHGCVGPSRAGDSCSTGLDDDDFTHNSVAYTVSDLLYKGNTLYFGVVGQNGSQTKTALAGLTLHAGRHSFAIDSATAILAEITWSKPSALSWSDDEEVTVWLVGAQAATKPSKPTNLVATAGDQQVALSWADPSDSTISKYQYQQRTGNTWGGWIDIPTSAPGETNATSYTVTGLTNGTAYRFRIRAVNSAGNSPQSEATPTVRPQASADTTGPTISTIAVTSSVPSGQAGYKIGDDIAVTATFNEDIVVVNTPKLEITVGSAAKSADCARKGSSGAAKKQLECTYTVLAGDADTDGISVAANKLTLPTGASIKDGSNNDATRTYTAITTQSSHKVDGVKPTISSISIASTPPTTPGGWYKKDNAIEVTATFSEALALTGSPTLKIDVGGTEKSATCAKKGTAGDDAKKLECSYTVAAGDEDTDGIAVAAGKLAGTIKDGSANAATLTYTAITAQSGHKVDAKGPSITVGAPTPTGPAQSKSITATATDSGSGIRSNSSFRLLQKTAAEACNDAAITLGGVVGSAPYRTVAFTSGTAVTFNSEARNGEYVCFATGDLTNNSSFVKSAEITGIDTTDPGIAFPASPAVPRLSTSSTITLTDTIAKIKKYGAIVVDGSTGADTDCDTAAKIGATNLTTETTPKASVNFNYTPPSGSLGKKVCVYAEDAAGNSDSGLWDSAIQQAPAKPKVTLVLGSATINESGSGNATTIKATLPSAPSAAVAVTLTLNPASGVVALGGTTLTIPTTGTDSPTVTVTAVNNDVDADNATVTISGATASTLVEAPDAVTLTVSDDDTAGVTLSSTGVQVNEGATATYTVKLDTKPTANVVITPTSPDTGAVTVSTAAANNTLTFTTSNWSTAQTVTVTGVQDADSTNESVTVTHSVSGGGYAGVSVGSVTVTVNDDEGATIAGLAAAPGNQTVRLTWTNPSTCTVSAPVCGYQYRYRETGGTWSSWTWTSPSSLTGQTVSLQPGTAYEFEVRRRQGGTTLAQGSVSATTTGPGAPAGLMAEGVTGGVKLTWTDPGDTTVTGYQYRVKSRLGGYGAWTAMTGSSATTTTWTVENLSVLSSGESYVFQVRARRGSLVGRRSAEVSAAPQAAAIAGGVSASASATSVTLSWTNPSTCSLPLCGYDYRYRESGGAWSAWAATATQTSHTVSGLTPETAYEFLVRRVQTPNTLAQSGVTATTGARTGVLPARPANLVAQGRDGAVYLAWDDPGDSSILRMEYRRKAGGGAYGAWTSTGGAGNTALVPGLENGTSYTFQVRAVNARGAGPASAAASAVPTATPAPGKPANAKAEAGYGRVTLTWTDPRDSTITKWQYSQDGGTTWKDVPGSDASTTRYTVTGLVNGTTYRFRVRAVNVAGAGTASDQVSLAPSASAVPERPEGLSAVAGSTRVTLRWTDPGDPAITKYQYRQKAAGGSYGTWTDLTATDIGTRLAYVVMSLRNGTVYTFQIRAVNANGNSAASAEAGATPSLVTVPTVAGVKIISRAVGTITVTETEVPTPKEGKQRVVYNRVAGGEAYAKGEKIWIEMTFSSARIAVEGRPVLELYVGGTSDEPVVRSADFLCLSADNRAVFEYRVVYADKDTDGISVRENGLFFPGDTDRIYDPRTNEDVNPNHSGLADDAGHKVNGLLGLPRNLKAPPMPTLANIVLRSRPADPDRGYVTGEDIRLDAIFTKAIPSVDGKPTLELQVGTETRRAEFKEVRFRSSDDTRWIQFSYTVQAGDSDADGISIPVDPIATNAADRIYRSWDREPAALAFAGLGAQARHKVNASGGMEQRGPDDEAVAPPLTASVSEAPAEHRGRGKFTVRVAFSEAVAGTPGAAAARIQVTGGTLTRARRVDRRKDLWALDIRPSSHEAVALTLPATSDCAAAGAVCTADGRKLETALTHTVPGPATLSVADARATEGEDATIDFAVTLSRAVAGEVSVRWRTRSGSAKAGRDFEAAKGTLVFAAGEPAKTVSVTVLDDAKDEGEETFRLLLSKPKGAVIADGEATGTIENDDPMPAAWLARFGRTVAGQAVDAVTGRLEGGGSSHVTLGGQRLSLDTPEGRAEAKSELDAVAAALGAGPGDVSKRDAWLRGEDRAVSSRTMTGRELMLGSAFHLASGGEAGGPAFAAWGRVAHGGFDGEEDGVTMDGEVTTGFLGADVAAERWLAGAAVAVSRGEGTFALAGDSARESAFGKGTVESSLTSVLPYARIDLSERVTAWGMAGYGTGELTLTEKGATETDRHTADLTMTLGAVGGRGTLVPAPEGGGFALALKTDAFWVRTESDATEGMEGAEADATRLRVTLDASRAFALGAGTLTPSLEVGLRHDGGDAETGTGIELGGGLGYTDPDSGVSMEARARWLAAHESSGYEEWGVSGSVRIDPGARGRGLSLTLSPTVGNAASGTGTLWSAADARGLAPGGEFEAARRLDAELGYGLALFGDRFTGTPNLGVALSDSGRDYRLGWRLTSAVRGDPGFEVNLDATRKESANDNAPEHGLMLRGAIRW